jgi:xanthine dehydrogenase accessory factor
MVGWIGGGGCTESAVRQAAAQAMADGKSRLIAIRPSGEGIEIRGLENFDNACFSGGTIEVFIEPIQARPTLIVLGASPVARSLVELACRVGFRVTVGALAEDSEGFEGAARRIEGFDLSGVARAASSFVVVATQGKGDRVALEAALRAGPRYLAFVGSRRKAAKLKEHFLDKWVDPRALADIRAPAGIDIGAAGPEEIALSILAEIVRERRCPTAETGVAEKPRAVEEPSGQAAVADCCRDDGV